MVMVGGWGELVMQHLACVAEVPNAGCLGPRLLMLSRQFIWDSRGSLAAVLKSSDRPASLSSWILHCWICITQAKIWQVFLGLGAPQWPWWGKGIGGRKFWAGRRVGILASENWKWPLWSSSSSVSSAVSLTAGHHAPAWTLPVLESSLLGKAHHSVVEENLGFLPSLPPCLSFCLSLQNPAPSNLIYWLKLCQEEKRCKSSSKWRPLAAKQNSSIFLNCFSPDITSGPTVLTPPPKFLTIILNIWHLELNIVLWWWELCRELWDDSTDQRTQSELTVLSPSSNTTGW